MDQTLFLSEAKLKQNSDLLENVDGKFVRNAILKSQRMKILPVLGTELYNKISDLIISGEISLSQNAVYKNLLDGDLQMAVIPFSLSYLLVSLSYKITQKGTMQNTDELSSPLDLQTMQYLIEKYDEEGQYWLNRILGYLNEYSSALPEYSNPDTGNYTNILPDTRNQWSSSIYLKGRNKNWYGDNSTNTGEENN